MPGLSTSPPEKQEKTQTMPQLWLRSLDESAASVSWSASGEWLAAASANGEVSLFEAATGERVQQIAAHRFGATRVTWHPEAALFATAGQDGKVRLWEPRRDSPVAELDCGSPWVEHIAWSDSGRYLATAAGRRLRLWGTDGTLVQDYQEHPNTIAAITWKTGAEELVSACYGYLQFWKPDESAAARTFLWKGSMLALAWSPDGRYLCHGNQDATVHFWIVKTGKELQMWGYPIKIRELAWDPRSRYLATGGGKSVTVWDCSGKGPANSKPASLNFHQSPLSRLAYQRSGSVLASGCAEGRIALWKPSKRKLPDSIGLLSGGIADLAWSPDDALLAAAAEDGSVAVYKAERVA